MSLIRTKEVYFKQNNFDFQKTHAYTALLENARKTFRSQKKYMKKKFIVGLSSIDYMIFLKTGKKSLNTADFCILSTDTGGRKI